MSFAARITQRDVAERAGVDKSTVSLALSESPRVSKQTRLHIKSVAKEMGYRPDPAIAQLARHRWSRHEVGAGSVLAYLVESGRSAYSLQCRHLAAVRSQAEERGFKLEEFDLSLYPSGKSASRVLYHRGVRGLILPTLPRGARYDLEEMDWANFTVVACTFGWHRAPCDSVTPDIFEGTRLLWEKAVKRGYRKIGAALFRHDPVALDDHSRLGASYVAQGELPQEYERIPFFLGEPEDESGFVDWYLEHRPDVVLSFISRPHQWLERYGVSVPGDVAFACLNVPEGSLLSGTCTQFDKVGSRAVDYLLAAMRDNRWGLPRVPETISLAPEWIEGVTLPPSNI